MSEVLKPATPDEPISIKPSITEWFTMVYKGESATPNWGQRPQHLRSRKTTHTPSHDTRRHLKVFRIADIVSRTQHYTTSAKGKLELLKIFLIDPYGRLCIVNFKCTFCNFGCQLIWVYHVRF